MCAFGGRLLAGLGNTLRMYDVGRKRLLRKCEVRLPHFATALQTQGWRIVVGDAHESTLFVHYRAKDNQFLIFCDDTAGRGVSALCMLDFDTVAGADRYGNFFVNRVPAAVSEEVESDSLGISQAGKQEYFFGAAHKLEHVVDFFVGDTVVAVSKCALAPGSREVLQYTTISGAVGIFVPFGSREDTLFFQGLEICLRGEASMVVSGRDHLVYRSYHMPIKAVVDGDLCAQFAQLASDRKHAVAQAVDRTPGEIVRKIEDMRGAGF